MASLGSTTPADIERLQAAVRTDRETARREIEARLGAGDLSPRRRHELLLLLATAQLETAELGPALTTTRAIMTWAETNGESLIAGRAQNMLGLIHWRLGDLPPALEMFTAARRNADLAAEVKLALQATGNMGLIQIALKQWEDAERGYRHVLAEAERLEDPRLVAIAANNLTFILWECHGPTDEALAFARRALAAKLPFQDWASIAHTANNIAGLLRDRRDYPAAHEALAAAGEWVRRANATPTHFYHALNRAQLLVAFDNPRRDDAAGFAAFDEAVALAHDAGMLEEEARAHEHAARAYAQRDDHAKAYTHLDRYTQLRESYLTDQSSQRIEKMRQAYEIDRLEREHRAERTRREELEALNLRLERIGRERDSLLRLIGHDLRTHVAGMVGLGELICDGLPAGAALETDARDLVALGESTLSLLQEIMEHGSALNGAFAEQEDFDLVASLHEVKVRLEPRFAAKNQPFDVRLPAGPVLVRSNRSGLGRIVENLLTNAVKFSPPGAATSLRLAQVNGQWEIAVIDHGQGIPPDEVPRLFRREQRLSVRPTDGESTSGFGLLLVHDLAQIIGVTLAHAPTPGGGATFFVRFPAPAAGPS